MKMTTLFTPVLMLTAFSQLSNAQSDHCYRFTRDDVGTEMASESPGVGFRLWCYRHVDASNGRTPGTFAYDATEGEVRPELSFFVAEDGTLTHASMSGGRLSYHKAANSSFDPFPVPLMDPEERESVPTELGPERNPIGLQTTLEHLQNFRQSPTTLTIEEGTFQAEVARNFLPFRGYWWPFREEKLFSPEDSPMGKFDRFLSARGLSPKTVAWERTHHIYHGLSWGGHCNGWVSSTILRTEPRLPVTDPLSHQTFSVGDQKGLLAEKDYCAISKVFGRRYPHGPLTDIDPKLFHETLVYFIRDLGKPVAADVYQSSIVDNHPISAYRTTVKKQAANTFHVVTYARVHRYDRSPENPPGLAPSYERRYEYILNTDARGNITGGTWISENPDFLWTALATASCPDGNPSVTEPRLRELLRLGLANMLTGTQPRQ